MKHVPRMSFVARVLLAACVAAVLLALGGCTSSMPGAGTPTTPSVTPVSGGATVVIKGFAFTPSTVTVKAGQTVTWRNDDAVPHDATADAFTSGTIDPGTTYTRVFDTPGTYTYVCKRHPAMAAATIVVQ